ncbi:MAG TPA: S26 family signal peptidase [Candidatus Thiothrix moscowensis]|uniref:S26 family signal peptidase n=1 Tax=unclassified Thiothrix TaxID=2636184 RepID=UPI0025F23597|nr:MULTISPECIES: S26 family signal peptidase [unclassified Thiothrix]HRJ52239.1 S26 family signal peptidase [Candidatus Thiothrix moscowensis]HRJ92554.1 S26 family signal peptidase [Candidatus Thiothrix moscowensis]
MTRWDQPAFRAFLGRFACLAMLMVCLAGVLASLPWFVSPYARFGLNLSTSLPGWVYVVSLGQTANLKPGDLIGFYPPKNSFYPTAFLFIKQVAGVPGDVVVFGEDYPMGTDFSINGQPMGTAKAFSSGGIALPHSAGGVIPPGSVFVWTPNPDSFDSRYAEIDLITEDKVVGRAFRIF